MPRGQPSSTGLQTVDPLRLSYGDRRDVADLPLTVRFL
jgi:hypothetical protein